jgi:hypothetical protein
MELQAHSKSEIWTTVFVLSLILLALSTEIHAQPRTDYRDYQITITRPSTINYSVVTVKRKGKTLAKHTKGLSTDYGSKVELISLLGSQNTQLVISQVTGGNHCCILYWVYDLSPTFRLLFKSEPYKTVGYSDSGELFRNLDSDLELEIVDETPVFHYFDDLAFVSSPRPTLVFDYDKKSGKFQLANRRFRSFLIGEADQWISKANAVKDTEPTQFSTWMFSIFLDYIYVGEKKKALDFYYKNPDLKRAGNFHKWNKVLTALKSDPAYSELYRK